MKKKYFYISIIIFGTLIIGIILYVRWYTNVIYVSQIGSIDENISYVYHGLDKGTFRWEQQIENDSLKLVKQVKNSTRVITPKKAAKMANEFYKNTNGDLSYNQLEIEYDSIKKIWVIVPRFSQIKIGQFSIIVIDRKKGNITVLQNRNDFI